MAISSSFGGAAAVLLLAVLSLLSSPAAARPGVPFHPCNTLFISYTITATSSSSSSFVSVLRIIRPSPQFHSIQNYGPIRRHDGQFFASRPHALPDHHRRHVGFSSLEDRAKDILVVVVGLLFGVGCGALTAATMYLVWSLLSNRFDLFRYGDDDEEEEIESPKKAGYVKIPAADAEAKGVKQGYEGN